jgi:parallel beta-helix repeat protein
VWKVRREKLDNIAKMILLDLLLFASLFLTLAIRNVGAAPVTTVTIDSHGAIVPASAPISQTGLSTYMLTGDLVSEKLVIQIDGITVNGAYHRIIGNGAGSGTGIELSNRQNENINHLEVSNFDYGINVSYANNNNLLFDNFSQCSIDGVLLCNSSANAISHCNVWQDQAYGVTVENSSSFNTLTSNNIYSCGVGIHIVESWNNTITKNLSHSNSVLNGNGYGIYVNKSPNTTVTQNTANLNTGMVPAGIYVSQSDNATLTGNNASANILLAGSYSDGCGIFVDSSNNCNIANNTAD